VAYLFGEIETDFTLTASQPIRLHDTSHMTINRMGYGKGCTVSSDVPAITKNVALILITIFNRTIGCISEYYIQEIKHQ
jgi:hypothetical protein